MGEDRRRRERWRQKQREKREGIASHRPLNAMRGTAVRSFLFGSVHPPPHTHTHPYSIAQSKDLGGVMTVMNLQ